MQTFCSRSLSFWGGRAPWRSCVQNASWGAWCKAWSELTVKCFHDIRSLECLRWLRYKFPSPSLLLWLRSSSQNPFSSPPASKTIPTRHSHPPVGSKNSFIFLLPQNLPPEPLLAHSVPRANTVRPCIARCPPGCECVWLISCGWSQLSSVLGEVLGHSHNPGLEMPPSPTGWEKIKTVSPWVWYLWRAPLSIFICDLQLPGPLLPGGRYDSFSWHFGHFWGRHQWMYPSWAVSIIVNFLP